MLDSAFGRVLSEDLKVVKNTPSFNNSALDGFAFKSKDAGKKLRIVATIYAGDEQEEILKEGECYKIMTGAKVPSDADTIVAIEDCEEVSTTSVKVPSSIKKGNALRLKGEELKVGDTLFKKGEKLDFSHIALLASQGIAAVRVYKKLSIAVVSTGNELKEPWEVASEDEIYNANSFGIVSLLKKFGFESSYAGLIPDVFEKTVEFIKDLKRYDVIITTGGISMGEADYLNEAFEKNGLKSFFHGVNVKPGRPTMMGKMDDTFVMAMPGNPLTTLLNVFMLSIPVLLKLQGSREYFHRYIEAKNIKEFKFKPKRSDIVLGELKEAKFLVTRDNKIGSGMLSPLNESDCVAIMGEDKSVAKEGEILKVIPFECSFSDELVDFVN
jgi:molybdopterin molybdotransferase